MKRLLLLATICQFVTFSPTVFANEQAMDEEAVHHYKGDAVETSEQAFVKLTEKTADIGKILEKEELEFLDLEGIHEITYTLEAAIDKIKADKAATLDRVEATDEAIQAIHFASENQEEDIVRKWFPKLQEQVSTIQDGSDDQVVEKEFYTIVIKDHKFTPDKIVVPAGKKIKLIVDNQDPTPEEFESDDMKREKIIGGMKKATVYVGPLEPGRYHFFGEFNLATANGYLIAK